MRSEYTMSDEELQDAISITNDLIINTLNPSINREYLTSHLKDLLTIQKMRAAYVTVDYGEKE